jgi:DNA invertase Pin-like site-specific DNA recombinase
VHVFTDRPTTVRKGLDRRPGEAGLLEAIRNGEIDRLCICSIDRVGRSLVELASFLETCRLAGTSLWIDEQHIDTAESNGMSLFDLGKMFSLHLRQSRRGRILQGLAASRAMSIPCGRPRLSRARTEKAERELAAGRGVREVARLAGISAASVSRLKNLKCDRHRHEMIAPRGFTEQAGDHNE